MADEAPLIFTRKLGGLFPANEAAERALSAVQGNVRVRITRTRGNNRRIALYWIILGMAAPMLEEKAPGLNADLLHKVLKDRYGLVKVVTLPSGQEVRDYDSISFHAMTEVERAKYIDFAFSTLASWLGCPVEVLIAEGRQAA